MKDLNDVILGDLRAIRASQLQHGQLLGSVDARLGGLEARCASRGSHCSEEFRRLGSRVGVAEDTGVHEIAKLKASEGARWGMLKWLVVPSLTAILGASGMAGALLLRRAEKPADVVRVIKIVRPDIGVISGSR